MGPPSYALMKRGTADAGALWSNYNIQLVEYADHGRPLADLLYEIARRAFGPAPGTTRAVSAGEAFSFLESMPVFEAASSSIGPPSVPSRPSPLPRHALEDE